MINDIGTLRIKCINLESEILVLKKELAESEAEVEFWKTKAYEAEESEGKHESEVEKIRGEIDNIKKFLKDPAAVHINMLRENIATLSWDSYEHILGPHPCRERAEKAEAEITRLKSLQHYHHESYCRKCGLTALE